MPWEKQSARFEVLLDGERLCVAGLDDRGVLGAVLSWVGRSPEGIRPEVRERPDFDEDEWLKETITLSITGLKSGTHESVEWHRKAIEVGQEVTIRILPPGENDPVTPASESGGGK